MAQWSDLPNELRFEIFRYLFINTVTSYSEWDHSRIRRNDKSLKLRLVVKSFARDKDIAGAMLSQAVLKLQTAYDFSHIGQNPKYGLGIVARIRSLDIHAYNVSSVIELPLTQLQSDLPHLSQVRICMSPSPYDNSRLTFKPANPTITAQIESKLVPLLMQIAKTTSRRTSWSPWTTERVIWASPRPSIWTKESFNMDMEYENGCIDRISSQYAIQRALLESSQPA